MKGLVFNIQRFSIHDGPGIRTTVFLKGCNLRCFWCHNPESQSVQPEIQLFSHKCINCGKCLEVCPVNAHRMTDGQRIFSREFCQRCGSCAENCYAEALVMAGQEMTVEEVMEEVKKDMAFYRNSGGGVTFSGGEPLLQKDFVNALLIESKKNGLHTTIDTAGHVPWEVFEEILPYVDLFLFDIKVVEKEKHRKPTGVKNDIIIKNLKKLVKNKTNLWIRIPVIPNLNDSVEQMQLTAKFVKGLNSGCMVEFLAFNPLAEGKYESLGLTYPAKGYPITPDKQMQQFVEIFQSSGIPVHKS